jgi:hypothetical protein
MGPEDEGRGNPTSVIPGSNRSGKRTGSPCLTAQNRVYMLSSLVKRINREVLINKGVTILKTMKKSNKQIVIPPRVKRNRSGLLSQ